MKPIITRIIACLLLLSSNLYAQTITLADGSALPDQYCWEDATYALSGTPAGGIFSGCGVLEENGAWYFNPVVATEGVTVFPISCNITYNDEFKLGNYGYQGVNAFMIFSRWGEKVYQTLDGTKGWDGTYRGEVADPGTYYYDIRLGLLEGTEQVLQGDLTLIR